MPAPQSGGPPEPPQRSSTSSPSSVVLDASAVLAVLFDEPGATTVADAIADGAVLSAVNLSEVETILRRRQQPVEDIVRRLAAQMEIEPFTIEDAHATAALSDLTRSAELSLGDRACVALAQRLSLPAVTADRNWASVDLDIEVKLLRDSSSSE